MKKSVIFLALLTAAIFMAMTACLIPIDPVEPIDGKISVECGNAHFTFDLKEDSVEITNCNSDFIHVTIKKNSFVQVDDATVYGNGIWTRSFYVGSGDRVYITVTIGKDNYAHTENFTVD